MSESVIPAESLDANSRPVRVGCVSFLNAKPLIDGLEDSRDPRVVFDVPSRLFDALEGGGVDIALCPMIDYFRSARDPVIVPVGCIGCDGPTLTVRLFSKVPLREITHVYADTDSHTSVTLLRILLAERFAIDPRPRVIDLDARRGVAQGEPVRDPQAVLLIGDKVVTTAPGSLGPDADVRYPHQLDLGQAWKEWTGLPFVFATWLAWPGADLRSAPRVLYENRLRNENRLDAIVARHAVQHGYSPELAQRYLGRMLRYELRADELRAIERFGEWALKLGLIDRTRPLRFAGTQDIGADLPPFHAAGSVVVG